MLMNGVLFEMEYVSSSEIWLCCFGDLVQNVCFPGYYIIHLQIFVSHMDSMHEKEAPASEAVYVDTFIYGIDRAATN